MEVGIMDKKLNQNKYQNSILYFTRYCNNNYLGATKLNKLMYYLDFLSFQEKGNSVTGDMYIHKDYGPVPESIDYILVALQEAEALSTSIERYDGDKIKTIFKNKKTPDLSVFSEYEKEILEKICQKFELWSTDRIVAQTHLEAPWFYSKPYEIVDYKYASSLDPFEDETTLASQ